MTQTASTNAILFMGLLLGCDASKLIRKKPQAKIAADVTVNI